MNVYRVFHVSFETTTSRFIQIMHHCTSSWKITHLYLFISNLYTLDKRACQSEVFKLLIGWSKINQFPYVMFKSTSQFFLNFASLFIAMRDNSFVLFYLKLFMIWTNGAHHSAKFQTFNCSRKISPNLYFDRLLKVYKILAEKVQRSYVSWLWRLMQNWRKHWSGLLFQKWQ